MQMTPIIAIHLTAALGAVATGPVALWARLSRQKHPRLHRGFGYAWVTLMLATAISALFIRDFKLPNLGGYTPIHLLVPLTLFSLFGAFWALARRNVVRHARIMKLLYGSLCIAGAFTLLPDRYLGGLLWGNLAGLLPILGNTPTWVWGLLAGLIALGATQLRERRQGLARVSLMPLAMVGFSLWSATSAFGRSPMVTEALWLWVLAAAATAALFAFAPSAARYDAQTRSFRLPGSWVPMLLFVGVFTARYVVAVRLALHPGLLVDATFVLPVAALYGAFSGMFLGRAAQLWRVAARKPAVLATA